jgi:hypothetical protein
MYQGSAKFFIEWNRHCDHGYVTWSDGSESEFPLTLSVEELVEYPLVFDYLSAQALAFYPARKKEEVRSIRIAYKIRQAKPWNPEETDDLINSLHRWYEREVKQLDRIAKEPFGVKAYVPTESL